MKSDRYPWEGRSLSFFVNLVEDELEQRHLTRAEGHHRYGKLEGVHGFAGEQRGMMLARPGGGSPRVLACWRGWPAARIPFLFCRSAQEFPTAGDFGPFPAFFLARLACFM